MAFSFIAGHQRNMASIWHRYEKMRRVTAAAFLSKRTLHFAKSSLDIFLNGALFL